jgi:hypothetical protein
LPIFLLSIGLENCHFVGGERERERKQRRRRTPSFMSGRRERERERERDKKMTFFNRRFFYFQWV